MRSVIVGPPRSGKTTAALLIGAATGATVMHTDSIVHEYAWSEQSEIIAATWFDMPGDWVCEGVAAVRAIRKRLASHPNEKPCDRVLVLDRQYVELSSRQEAMAKRVRTVLAEIEPELRKRGVEIAIPTAVTPKGIGVTTQEPRSYTPGHGIHAVDLDAARDRFMAKHQEHDKQDEAVHEGDVAPDLWIR